MNGHRHPPSSELIETLRIVARGYIETPEEFQLGDSEYDPGHLVSLRMSPPAYRRLRDVLRRCEQATDEPEHRMNDSLTEESNGAETQRALSRPKFTVLYNISPDVPGLGSKRWVGTGWEFFDHEVDARARYEELEKMGHVPCIRPFHYNDVPRMGAAHYDSVRADTKRWRELMGGEPPECCRRVVAEQRRIDEAILRSRLTFLRNRIDRLMDAIPGPESVLG